VAHQHAWDVRALNEALERGYVVARGPRSFAPRVWRAWCRDERRPCLIVHAPGARAGVELDLRPARRRLTDAGSGRIAAAAAARGLTLRLTAVEVRTDSAPLERAEDLAAALLEVLADPASTKGT
jgi:hypothetical protein